VKSFPHSLGLRYCRAKIFPGVSPVREGGESGIQFLDISGPRAVFGVHALPRAVSNVARQISELEHLAI
jgi:hypothetical protein